MTLRESTALRPLGERRFAGQVTQDWFVVRGPNGGWIAALALRALAQVVDDPARTPRSLTLHYQRPPAEGELEVEVDVLRTGRSLTSLAVRMHQRGELCVAGLAAYSTAFPSKIEYSASPPESPSATDVDPVPLHPRRPPMAERFDVRHTIGDPPVGGGDHPRSGGWLALREPEPVDHAMLALFCDAWVPTPFILMDTPHPAPTIDLTVHFRVSDPGAHVAPGEPVLAVFESKGSADGLFDEEGELWSAGGVLLAQSRQLALLMDR